MSAISERLDRGAAGPAPWYWKTFPNFDERHEWRFVQAGPIGYPSGNPVFFERRPRGEQSDARPVLIARIYSRVLGINGGHVLLWGPRGQEGDLLVETFAVNELGSVEMPAAPDPNQLWTAAAPVLDHITIPQGLPAGRAPGRCVARAASTDLEVLLLAEGPSPREAATSIYVWRPASGSIDVIPLSWYREDTNDLGYEWVTRVMRDQATGHIFGDGIRLGPFELDAEGRLLRPTS